ncbi:hypothetical protein CHUAL_013508 [Chamberlinius hualienensis]
MEDLDFTTIIERFLHKNFRDPCPIPIDIDAKDEKELWRADVFELQPPLVKPHPLDLEQVIKDCQLEGPSQEHKEEEMIRK